MLRSLSWCDLDLLFPTHLIILCVFTGHKISKLPLNTSVDPQALWIPDSILCWLFLILQKSHNLFHTSWYVTNCIHAKKKFILKLTNSYVSNCMFLYDTYNLASTISLFFVCSLAIKFLSSHWTHLSIPKLSGFLIPSCVNFFWFYENHTICFMQVGTLQIVFMPKKSTF